MSARRSAAWFAIASVVLVACANDLDREPLVKSPRILAIVTDPPEALPGQDVHVRVLAFDPMGRELHYAFRFCIDPAALLGGFTPDGSNGQGVVQPICFPLRADHNTATVPGALTQAIATQLPMYAAMGGINADTATAVLATVGLPLQIRVALSAPDPAGVDAPVVSGLKLFGLTTRATRTTNPPYVFFSVGGSVFLGGVDPSSFECELFPFSDPPVFRGSVPDARPGHPDIHVARVALRPLDDPFQWMETYPYFDYSSGIQTGREGAYYSWFTTSDVNVPCMHSACHTIVEGDDTTQVSATADPTDPSALMQRDAVWELPSTPGTYDLWLVVRDGHAGEAACHTTIEVTAIAATAP